MGGYDKSVIEGASTVTVLLIVLIWFILNVIVSPERSRQASIKSMNPFRSNWHSYFKRGIWALILFYGFILYNNLGKFDSDNPRLGDKDRLFEYLEILGVIYLLLLIELARANIEMNTKVSNMADSEDYKRFYLKNEIPIVADCTVCSNPIPLFHGLIIGKKDKKWINRLAMIRDVSNYLSDANVDVFKQTTDSNYLRRQIDLFYKNKICMKLDSNHKKWLESQKYSTQLSYVECVNEIKSSWRIIHYRYLMTLVIIILLFQYAINTFGPNQHNKATQIENGIDQYPEYYGWAVATVVRAFCILFLVFLHHGVINDRAVLVNRLYWNDSLKLSEVELMIKQQQQTSRPYNTSNQH